jgi:hypothetical protein
MFRHPPIIYFWKVPETKKWLEVEAWLTGKVASHFWFLGIRIGTK